jgi:hypothetical protein
MFIQGIKVTKTKGFTSFNVACKWKRKINGAQTCRISVSVGGKVCKRVVPKEGWFIITNFDTLELAIEAYKKRFDIEEMFRDFKKGGYNLEDTNVSGNRFISLVILIAIAYTATTIQGQEIKRKGIQEYVSRVKENGRAERRHSSFYIGLYGQTWVDFKEPCIELVNKLMKLNRNKMKYYQRGMRAMKLIESML